MENGEDDGAAEDGDRRMIYIYLLMVLSRISGIKVRTFTYIIENKITIFTVKQPFHMIPHMQKHRYTYFIGSWLTSRTAFLALQSWEVAQFRAPWDKTVF
jgi:hypothetical protein